MTLVDTSVWVNHFRRGDAELAQKLVDGLVLMHPFVLGEIACGNLHRRPQVLNDLEKLPLAVSASHSEVMQFLETHKLFGSGLGWIDAHLLASALLSNCRIWSHDRGLQAAASKLNLVVR